MNYNELTKFIAKNNSIICTITTWQTWGKLYEPAVNIMLQLGNRCLLEGYEDRELYKIYKEISIDRFNWEDLIKSRKKGIRTEIKAKLDSYV